MAYRGLEPILNNFFVGFPMVRMPWPLLSSSSMLMVQRRSGVLDLEYRRMQFVLLLIIFSLNYYTNSDYYTNSNYRKSSDAMWWLWRFLIHVGSMVCRFGWFC